MKFIHLSIVIHVVNWSWENIPVIGILIIGQHIHLIALCNILGRKIIDRWDVWRITVYTKTLTSICLNSSRISLLHTPWNSMRISICTSPYLTRISYLSVSWFNNFRPSGILIEYRKSTLASDVYRVIYISIFV